MQTRTIGGYSILAIPTLSRTIGGGVGMAGCHTLLIKDCLVGALGTSAPPAPKQKKVSKVV